MTLLPLLLLVAMLLFGLPVTFALMLSGAVGLYQVGGFNMVLGIIETAPASAVSSYELITFPMFILMAEFMIVSRIADEMFEMIGALVRKLPGGLAVATAITGAAFGAVSGSSTAAAATLSVSSVPTMIRHGYDPKFASGVVAISGTLAMLIPPSIALILYGMLSGENIAELLIAGIVPGLLVMLAIVVTVMSLVRWRPEWAPKVVSSGLSGKHPVAAILFLMLFTAVTVTIYIGIATPTEASAIGAFGSFLIAYFRGRIDRKSIRTVLYRATTTTSMIVAIVIGAQIFGYYVTATRLPQELIQFVIDSSISPGWILLGMLVFYLLLGLFLDQIAILILTVPIVLPLVLHLGYDPVWFGVLIVVIAEIGLVTPPVGLNVFVVAHYTKVATEDVFAGVLPHIVAHLLVVLVLVLFPALALWLPSTMN